METAPLGRFFCPQRAGAGTARNYGVCAPSPDAGLVVTNIPRRASASFNCPIAMSAVAELFALSMCRRRVFKAGSLSLITHLRANTLASCRLAMRTTWVAPGKLASK